MIFTFIQKLLYNNFIDRGFIMRVVEFKQLARGLDFDFYYDRGLRLWTLRKHERTEYFTRQVLLSMTVEKFKQSYLY
jgi:hypothetical protein